MSSDGAADWSPVASGTRFGCYEIVELVGRGGMAEIYSARDLRLRREVAIKLLPSEFGADPKRLRRFEQEARAMCRLNHPNIVSVYDVDHDGSTPFIVTELLEGRNLRDQLQKGRVSLRQALAWGVQIARGLASAHESGIVHRDLKPANVFITPDGHLKILDFGLAKLTHPEWDGIDADANTISVVSRPGVIVGSIGYMAPEQVEGSAVDHRSDIFSLGVILYEMLTGTRAFREGNAIETLHSILKDEPRDVRELAPEVDDALARIVRRCMEKRPELRFDSARDLAFSLGDLLESSSSVLASSIAFRRPRFGTMSRGVAAFATAGLLLTALSVLGARIYRTIDDPGSGPPPASNVAMTRITTSGNVGGSVALSPDGQFVAYDTVGDEPALWLAHVPSGSSTRLLSNVRLGIVRFSPDGNNIFYVRWEDGSPHANLFSMPLLGGAPRLVVRNVQGATLTFSPDGGRVAYTRDDPSTGGQLLLSATVTGDDETKISSVPKGRGIGGCAWSPGGGKFICWRAMDDGYGSAMIEIDAATGAVNEQTRLPQMTTPSWVPGGGALVGDGEQVVRARYPDGRVERLTNDLSNYFVSNLSRDGQMVAAIRIDTITNLWTMTAGDPKSLRQITSGVNTFDGNQGVATTPDGRIVAASQLGSKSIDLWICDADGENRRRLTFDDSTDETRPDVSPDGSSVIFVQGAHGSDNDEAASLWRVDLNGSKPVQLTREGGVRIPRFSADGRRVIYTRRFEGKYRAYEISVDGGEPRQLSENEVSFADESPDGTWLAITTNDDVELWPVSGIGKPVALGIKTAGKQWKADGSGFSFLRNGNVHFFDLKTKKVSPLTGFSSTDGRVAWAHAWFSDGERLVFPRRSATRDIVLLTFSR